MKIAWLTVVDRGDDFPPDMTLKKDINMISEIIVGYIMGI